MDPRYGRERPTVPILRIFDGKTNKNLAGREIAAGHDRRRRMVRAVTVGPSAAR
jgi:hypothetical protein